MKISTSLAMAQRDEFVYLGRQGEVRSPLRYRAERSMRFGIAVCASVAGIWISAALGLPWLALLYIGVLGYGGRSWRASERLKRGATSLAANRLEEAERQLLPLTTMKAIPPALRAIAWQNLAGVSARKGDPREALVRVRRCAELLSKVWWSATSPWQWISGFSEVQLLAQLGEIEAAAARLRALERAPRGEYFFVLRMNAELMLAFASGDPARVPDDVHAWVRCALETTTAELALVLLAWVHVQRGDEDMADLLIGEACDRMDADLFSRIYPSPYAWLRARRAKAERCDSKPSD